MATPDDPDRPRRPEAQGPYGPPPQGPYGPGPYGGGPLPPPPSGPPGRPGGPWPPPPPTGGGLGTAALVLGIAAIVLLPVCGIGTLVAIPGLIVGIVATIKKSNMRRAVIGLALSVATLVIVVIFIVLLYYWMHEKGLNECFDPARYPTQEAVQRCVESKLGGGVQ